MKKIVEFTVVGNETLNSSMFLLTLHSDDLPLIRPGQFVNVKVEDSPATFLRRPISVHDVDTGKKLLYLLIKKAGTGTGKLSDLKEGEILNVILPLGNTFSIPESGQCLLIGGGVGIAPMLHLAKEMKGRGLHPVLLIGGRTREDIVRKEVFERYAELHCSTEDGTFGEKGYPTRHSVLSQHFDHIFCCGPEVMMKAVAGYAYERNIDCEVSLENTMACGIGACLCCVTETREGHKCVCSDGPVFNIKDLKWQS